MMKETIYVCLIFYLVLFIGNQRIQVLWLSRRFVLNPSYTAKIGWAISGIVFALLTGIGMFISWFGLRGTETNPNNFVELESKDSIFVILKKNFKIRAFRQICLMTIIGIIGITIVEAVEMYLFVNRFGYVRRTDFITLSDVCCSRLSNCSDYYLDNE